MMNTQELHRWLDEQIADNNRELRAFARDLLQCPMVLPTKQYRITQAAMMNEVYLELLAHNLSPEVALVRAKVTLRAMALECRLEADHVARMYAWARLIRVLET